jgi:hypothetical protein
MRWPLVVSLVIVLLAGGLWYGKLRERADAATVQNHVAVHYPGSTVGCVEIKANASLWGCGVVYRAESICLAVAVSATGDVSPGKLSARRCVVPGLRRMLPAKVEAGAVAADVGRIKRGPGSFVCAQAPNSQSHWACARQSAGEHQCVVVRVVPWVPLRPDDGGGRCRKIPSLRAAVPF